MNHSTKQEPIYKSFSANTWAAVAVVVGTTLFYLLTHHKKHVFDALPYILIAAMILMHAGGHSGHDHGGKRHG